jgi:hypothetical protein
VGGAIWNIGRVSITDTFVTDNSAGLGGGIFTEGELLSVTRTTFARNIALFDGGAIVNFFGTVTVTDSTLFNNSSGSSMGGGGAFWNGSTTVVINSTIANNIGRSSEGVPTSAGGIFNDGLITLINSTVARNTLEIESGDVAGSGGGGIGNIGIVRLQNTILAQNAVTGGLGGPDCFGPTTSLGNNIIGDLSGCDISLLPTDLIGDPGLRAFADNDKPGNGHFPLRPTSQAIDAGNDDVCPKRDQLGRRRIGPCDIGAIRFLDGADRKHKEQDDHHHEEDLVAAVH